MYLTAISYSNIIVAVNRAARAMEKPTVQDWNEVKRTFRYLKGTVNHGIMYKRGTF